MENLIKSLIKGCAYPHKVDNVQLIQTHISLVFLTGEFAYKICKPVNFGFLDFSTLDKRKVMCEKEVKFNSLISPELYLGVVEIWKQDGGYVVDLESNSILEDGEIVDYAIKMKQCNPDTVLKNLLIDDNVSEQLIIELARKIAEFHQIAPTSEAISKYGQIETIKFNWGENFEQTTNLVEDLISKEDFNFVKHKVNFFIETNQELFSKRVQENKIKHCHGDLHSGNIFVENSHLLIFDGIIFNERFPNSDIIADLAFMTMDLEFLGKENFSKLLIAEYLKVNPDEDMSKLLDFYACYRAYVKAKVVSFMLFDDNVPADKKEQTKEEVKKYFSLVKKYAERFC